jgi:hypothetical protein
MAADGDPEGAHAEFRRHGAHVRHSNARGLGLYRQYRASATAPPDGVYVMLKEVMTTRSTVHHGRAARRSRSSAKTTRSLFRLRPGIRWARSSSVSRRSTPAEIQRRRVPVLGRAERRRHQGVNALSAAFSDFLARGQVPPRQLLAGKILGQAGGPGSKRTARSSASRP